MPKALEIQGKRFGRLLVIERARVAKARNVMWLCQCDCGRTTIAAAANIGKTTFSCGCLAVETATALLRGNTNTKTHGMSHTPEHNAWLAMLARCYQPSHVFYARYGGRGIKVCERWRTSFENFFADMGYKPSKRYTVDRIDNEKDYTPDNCRWSTYKVQANNRSSTHLIEIEGTTRSVKQWCEVLGLPRSAPYELTRGRHGPPRFSTAEAALRYLYEKHHS